jgi:hypothetical protein
MNAARVKPVKASRFIAAAFLAASGFIGAAAGTLAADRNKVIAEYDISFNGFNIGSFRVDSAFSPDQYSMKADARISVLAGILFEWHGKTTSSGGMSAGAPRPEAYSFGYTTSDKRETIDVEFDNNNVKQVAVSPPQREAGGRIPVTRNHMRNVVDPLSAIVMMTNVGSGNKSGTEVCTRRLPIFDGKARYDLQLSYKKTKPVETAHGYKGPAYICKVKFRPIAGHRRGDDEANFAANNEGMEIWMIPLRQADLYVPYYVYIPTAAGTASLTSSNIRVDTTGGGQGALLQ